MKTRKEAMDAPSVDGVPVMIEPAPETTPVSIVPLVAAGSPDAAVAESPDAAAAVVEGTPAETVPRAVPSPEEPAGEPTRLPVPVVVPQPRPAPPAYLWEAASGVASGGAYRSARPRAFILVALLAVSAVAAIASAGHRILEILTMDRVVDGPRTISGVAAFDAQGVSLDRLGIYLAVLVLIALIAWVARSIDNLGPLALATPMPPASPRMSIAWWLIPLANLLMPFVIVHDLYRRVAGGRRAWIVLGAWALTLAGIAIVTAVLTRGPQASSVVDLRLTVGTVSGAVALVGRQVSTGALAIGEIVLALAAVLGLVTVRRIQSGAGRRARARAAYAAELAEEAVDASSGLPIAAPVAAVPESDGIPVLAGDDAMTEPLALPAGAVAVAAVSAGAVTVAAVTVGAVALGAAPATIQIGEPVEVAAAQVAN
ncbi:MAG: DUF4328 domain-containing protein [Candidatus Limnocylindrales bacterium]